jgi:hypothetical protein
MRLPRLVVSSVARAEKDLRAREDGNGAEEQRSPSRHGVRNCPWAAAKEIAVEPAVEAFPLAEERMFAPLGAELITPPVVPNETEPAVAMGAPLHGLNSLVAR